MDSQKKYRLRLYDNTVDAAGNTGNYSETAFYAVRDNTPPNMGGNGLAGVSFTAAAEMLLSFGDGRTVYDTGAYTQGYDISDPYNISQLYLDLFGRPYDLCGFLFWKAKAATSGVGIGQSFINTILSNAAGTDKPAAISAGFLTSG